MPKAIVQQTEGINPAVLFRGLRPQQRKLIRFAQACQGMKVTAAALCRMADVNRENLSRWLEGDPAFRRCWREIVPIKADAAAPGVLAAMEFAAIEGDVKAAQLVLTAGGYLQQQPGNSGMPQTAVQVNIENLSVGDLEQYRAILDKLAQQPPPAAPQ